VLRAGQQRKPDDFWINECLADHLANAEPPQLDEAIGFHRAALAVRPLSPGAHFNLGHTLMLRGKLVEAETAFRTAIKLNPDIAIAHDQLGRALREQRRPVEAEVACRKAIELKADLASAHNNLGAVLWDQRRQVGFRRGLLQPRKCLA
jgi:Flp pilus assembly protein TadD